jgi:magnesium transporter
MIRSLFYKPDQPLRTDLSTEEFQALLQDPEALLWVDFSGEPPEVCEPILRAFNFHPLAIDDALQETHSPKLDDWGEYLYIVLNYMRLEGDNGNGWQTDVDELDVFLGTNYVITHHDNPIPALDDTWAASHRDPRTVKEGADHLLYKVIDNLVAGYMPTVEAVDQAIDEIEDQVFDRPSPRTLERLFSLKRVLLSMRRILLPQREVLNKLARDDYPMIDPRDRIFFRDIYDHIVRLHDLNESLRDLVGGAQDTYLSVINNRMNEVMKTLTVITTLFMPITFVTGFFGMNFFEPVAGLFGWTSQDVFLVTLGVIALFPAGMFFWMRSRTWV